MAVAGFARNASHRNSWTVILYDQPRFVRAQVDLDCNHRGDLLVGYTYQKLKRTGAGTILVMQKHDDLTWAHDYAAQLVEAGKVVRMSQGAQS